MYFYSDGNQGHLSKGKGGSQTVRCQYELRRAKTGVGIVVKGKIGTVYSQTFKYVVTLE